LTMSQLSITFSATKRRAKTATSDPMNA
jgi:hypothetical protein